MQDTLMKKHAPVFIILIIACSCAQVPSVPSRVGVDSETPGLCPAVELREKVIRLLKLLTSEKYKEREEAHAGLGRLLRGSRGGSVLEQLRNACRDTDDPEAEQRLEKMLQPYDRWQITPSVLDAVPDIVELLEEDEVERLSAVVESLRSSASEETCGVLPSLVASMVASLKEWFFPWFINKRFNPRKHTR